MKKYALYALPLVIILGVGIGFAVDIKNDVRAAEQAAMKPQAQPKVGEMAPEIALKNAKGEVVKLSSLKGKIVLIDFWAGWCGPCRAENVNLVKTYNRFKTAVFKNASEFTVYSVSLDNNATQWQKAIEKDQLTWPYHVSDLKKWDSEVVSLYGLESIPMNFLVDETGKIIAKGLRGTNLDAELEKLQQQ